MRCVQDQLSDVICKTYLLQYRRCLVHTQKPRRLIHETRIHRNHTDWFTRYAYTETTQTDSRDTHTQKPRRLIHEIRIHRNHTDWFTRYAYTETTQTDSRDTHTQKPCRLIHEICIHTTDPICSLLVTT